MKKQLSATIYLSTYFLLGLIFNLICFNANARKVTLTKTGGNGLLDIAGIYIAPNYSQSTITNTIDWDENNVALGTVNNWTNIFTSIQNIVNNDSGQNNLPTVFYNIEIDAPDSNNPMIIGHQSFNTNGIFALGSQIMQFGQNDSFHKAQPINDIKISGGNNKAYLKYKDSLYYGSWLFPLQSFTYLQFYYDHDNDISTANVLYNTTTAHPDYWVHSRILNYPSGIDTITYQNPSTTDSLSLNDVPVLPNSYWRNFYNYSMLSTVGYFVTTINCNHHSIENIEVDGNSANSKMGGMWGDVGIQAAYSGIYLLHTKNCNINNVNADDFGLDGYMISGTRTDSINVSNSSGLYNGRQGVSWIGGKHVSFFDCNFSHTGKSFNNYANKYLASAPTSGIDLEPENGDSLFNGYFDNCIFEDNTGSAVVNDFSTVYNMNFKRCTLHDIDGWGLWIRGYNFKFDSCHIYTSLVHGYSGDSLNGETKFLNCDFEDKPYQGLHWTHGYRLISYDNVKKTLFQNCTFTLNDSLREFFWLNWSITHQKSDWSIIDNCTFIYNNLGKLQDGPKSYLKNVKFRNKNKITNILNGGCSFKGVLTENIELEGSATPCEPSELIIEGQINHSIGGADSFNVGKTNLGTDGYALYKTKNKALTGGDFTVIINISSNSSFEIEKNGSLYGGMFLPAGRFVINDSSYFNIVNGSFISTTSPNSLVYIDNGCNPNTQSTASYWLTNSCFTSSLPAYSSNWGGSQVSAPLCVQGGNSYYFSNSSNLCNPIYTEISDEGPFSITYTTTNVSCFGGNDGILNLSIFGGLTGSYTYTQNGIFMGALANTLSGFNAGTYTINVTDGNGCSNSIVFSISEPSSAITANITSSTNVSCNGGNDGSATVLANGGTGAYTYTWNPSGGTNASANSLTAGTFIVTVKDANLCSITTSINITEPQPIVFNLTGLPTRFCENTFNITASGGTLTTSYPDLIFTMQNPIGISGIMTQTGVASNLGVGVFTVIVTDANGCTKSMTFERVDESFCCNSAGSNLVNDPNTILINNLSASSIGTFNYPVNSKIYIHGTYTVDANVTMNGCEIYFTPNSEISVINGHTLSIDQLSVLTTLCESMWKGISADGNTNKVSIKNSTIKHMYNGITCSNGAFIECLSNRFIDNYVGIQLSLTPIGYNHSNTNCIIRKNTFTSSNLPLKSPYATQSKTEFGIILSKCQEAQIGLLNGDPLEKNIFESLYNGIYFLPAGPSITQNIKIYNNDFLGIKNDPSTSVYPELDIINGCYNSYRGAGIYLDRYNPIPINISGANHSLIIENMADAAKFDNCDKAVVGHYVSADIKNATVTNTLMGFMFTAADFQNYKIGDPMIAPGSATGNGQNKLYDVFIGTQLIGNTSENSYVNNNFMTLFNGGILNGPNLSQIWPTGIDIKQVANPNKKMDLINNVIYIQNKSATGIRLNNTGRKLNCILNTISMQTIDASPKYMNQQVELKGIELNICNGSILKGNTVYGLNSLSAYNARLASGIKVSRSQNIIYNCNHVNNTRYGFYIFDKCITDPATGVLNNDFDNHNNAILFTYGADEGSLDNIGVPTNDNNNTFSNSNLSKPYVSGYKLYRIATNPLYINSIYTNEITAIESSSNIISSQYQVQLGGPNVSPECQSPYTLNDGGGNEIINLNDAFSVVNDSIQSLTFPEVGEWMKDRELYASLDIDTITRMNNFALNNFYTLQSDSTIGDLQMTDVHIRTIPFTDSALYKLHLNMARNLNNSITSTKNYEVNELTINNIYFDYLELGWESLSFIQKQFVELMAKSCPYINGFSVYKARTLWTNEEPGFDYNDLYLCSNGTNKTDVFAGIKEYLENTSSGIGVIPKYPEYLVTKQPLIQSIETNNIHLFPNPASNVISIECKIAPKGKVLFQLFDYQGKIVKSVQFENESTIFRTDIDNITSGLYTYKISIDNLLQKTGKLNIIK